jgi:hypothetical protein
VVAVVVARCGVERGVGTVLALAVGVTVWGALF